ncbi:hypothetical protein EDC04DRAFT_2607284 [Pisolithus marmoratus]|nr:hypothetical protein EDC04DRAFT_2607284 [Pisolithus marmoratus]
MLHWKSLLEKWDFLEKHFGLIPRPDSWLAAEDAMQQHDSQPKQVMAGDTAQSTCNHHHEPENLPTEEEGSLDSPNDHSKTKSGYLTLEIEVVDMWQVEDNLPEVEVGAVDAKWLSKCLNTLKAPDEGSQHASDKIKESQASQGLSSKALKPKGDLPDTTSECAKTKTGHMKPKPDIVDTWQVVDILSMVEDGIADQEWLDEQVHTLKASDKSQCTANEVVESQDSPEWSTECYKHEILLASVGNSFNRPDEVEGGDRNDDAPSSGYVDSLGVKKTLLADSRSARHVIPEYHMPVIDNKHLIWCTPNTLPL